MDVIIVSPSLDTTQNVSGISSVTQFIIDKNPIHSYIHFEQGKKDNEPGGIRRIMPLMRKLREWKKLLKEYPDATIHYNFPLSASSIIRDYPFIRYAQIKKRKLIIHIHGGVYLTSPQIPTLLNMMLKKFFKAETPLIVLSDNEKRQIEERYGAKNISILPNCVDVKENLSKEHNEESPLIIGYLGRITKEKGMGYLLQATKNLIKSDIKFKLIIAGKEDIQGEYIPRFEESLGDLFCYEGVVSGVKKDEFISNLDIFILPSFYEGLPMSLLECMAKGVVPITTNVGSISDVVDGERNGMFINIKDSTSIYNAVCKLNRDRRKLKDMSLAAYKTILSSFSPQKYIDELNNIYKGA